MESIETHTPETGIEGVVTDSWTGLRRHTSARIALGRAGGSQRTDALLHFRLSHAMARDAVKADFSSAQLLRDLSAAHVPALTLETLAQDRSSHLLRPDRGRRLADASREKLRQLGGDWGQRDLVIIISDGLSSLAAQTHAAALTVALCDALLAAGWSLYPVLVVPFGRVKLQDDIGETLGASHSLMLLGERPGLGAPDSLGAYFTLKPRASCTDADRNCLSNIRPAGLPPEAAARKLVHLLQESRRLGISGVALKDLGTELQ